MIARTPRQPGLQSAHFVGTIFGRHQLDLESLRQIGLDFIEKAQELSVSVPLVAVADGNKYPGPGGRLMDALSGMRD